MTLRLNYDTIIVDFSGLTEDEISAILHLIKVMKRNRSGVT